MPDDIVDTAIVREKMKRGLIEGMHAITEDLLGRAVFEAPLLTGRLKASGHADVYVEGDTVTGIVTFSTPYAARQHERTDYKHPRGGKAHYLSDPLKSEASRYEGVLAAHVEAALNA